MIEVEKKFHINPETLTTLLKGTKLISDSTITDTYFDDDVYSLTTHDVWLRKRDALFELKIPIDNHKGLVTRYREITDEDEIYTILKIKKIKTLAEDLNSNNIKPFAVLKTQRRTYKKDIFTIDIDDVDYGYALCEIELLVEKPAEVEEASQKILAFAKEHDLDLSKKRGKLVEYIYRFRPEHYRVLKQAWSSISSKI